MPVPPSQRAADVARSLVLPQGFTLSVAGTFAEQSAVSFLLGRSDQGNHMV